MEKLKGKRKLKFAFFRSLLTVIFENKLHKFLISFPEIESKSNLKEKENVM